jgi:pentatricopeptide repeat protein
MEFIFNDLVHDKQVTVNSTHWASRISAYGCVNRDLEKALSIFDQIQTHPKSSRRQLPDAICFEAIFNVLNIHHRVDLIPEYLDRMAKLGVHMTAYCANLLIKGYAAANDITKAREAFENMSDPAFGVAAPDNHEPTVDAKVPFDAPVYREVSHHFILTLTNDHPAHFSRYLQPSTWEAMVRAELGQNNKQEAIALMERMQSRGYPQAVLNRVNGIMHDDTFDSISSTSPTTPSDSQSQPLYTSGLSTPISSVF